MCKKAGLGKLTGIFQFQHSSLHLTAFVHVANMKEAEEPKSACAKITKTRDKRQWVDSQTGKESGTAYVISVDVPRHVPVRDQLPVDVASDLAVPPAAVDVNDADHVPLSEGRDTGSEIVRAREMWGLQ